MKPSSSYAVGKIAEKVNSSFVLLHKRNKAFIESLIPSPTIYFLTACSNKLLKVYLTSLTFYKNESVLSRYDVLKIQNICIF